MRAPGAGRRLAAVAMLFCGVLGWFFYYVLFRTTPGQDWMVFDTAAHAWRQGDIALLFDGPRFTAVLNATHGWLREKLAFHPWVYPPYTMLLALPFSYLPFAGNYAAFLALSGAGMVAALWPWRRGAARAWLLAAAVLSPACAFTLGAGQNSFMTAGLVAGGILCMHRRPSLAGLLIGLLAFKPQLALLLPLALIAAGAWRALGAAIVTGAALMAASLVVPGLAVWQGWLHLFLSGDPAFHAWVEAGRLYGQSVFSCLRVAGLGSSAANAAQLAAIAAAALCVVLTFRAPAPAPADRKLAVLLSAMILAAPHVGNYDAILLCIAAGLVLTMAAPPRAGETLLAALLWCGTGFQPPFVIHAAALFPLVTLAFLVLQTRLACAARPYGMPRPA